MIAIVRTDSLDNDFKVLVAQLDRELAARDGDDHAFFAQYNKIDLIRHVVLAYDGSDVVGCGAIKEYAADTVEVKRMFVPLERRGQGIASVVLKELENWAIEMNYAKCILETGWAQPEAIRLYEKSAYKVIPNYGQYAGVELSVCFEKVLR